jgi:imidazoleglycerol-phosphate dehydratase
MAKESLERTGKVRRATAETDIELTLTLNGAPSVSGTTGIGFFDHMLGLFARHGGMTVGLNCRGDLHVDAHHTVEDVGICLGRALVEALGEKKGIRRYGLAYVPMDECLARAVVDLSGRGFCLINVELGCERVGDFEVALAWVFFRALADNGRFNLHLDLLRGGNAHHAVEACFKAVARALAEAASVDPSRGEQVPSTKGVL